MDRCWRGSWLRFVERAWVVCIAVFALLFERHQLIHKVRLFPLLAFILWLHRVTTLILAVVFAASIVQIKRVIVHWKGVHRIKATILQGLLSGLLFAAVVAASWARFVALLSEVFLLSRGLLYLNEIEIDIVRPLEPPDWINKISFIARLSIWGLECCVTLRRCQNSSDNFSLRLSCKPLTVGTTWLKVHHPR